MTHRLQCKREGAAYVQQCPFCQERNAFRFDESGVAEFSDKCEHVQSLHTVETDSKAIQFQLQE